MNITQKELVAILQVTLTAFRKEIGEDVTALRILTLLAVVEEPGIPQLDLEKVLGGVASSTVSRNILDLTRIKRNKDRGPDLLEQRIDPMYRKRNTVYPTPKAMELVSDLTAEVNAKVSPKAA